MNTPERPRFAPAPGPGAAPHPAIIDAAQVPERRGIVGFLSHVGRSGDWILPRHFRVAATMASVELDLTIARLAPGMSHIEIMALMASVTILVPPDLRIECDGDPFIGSFEMKHETESTRAPDAPLVRVSGVAILGSVEVKVVDPNAPTWFERLHARWAKASAG